MLSLYKLKANPFPIGDGFATQRVVATTLHKVPEYAHKKTTALTVVFLVRPQGLEPWTH